MIISAQLVGVFEKLRLQLMKPLIYCIAAISKWKNKFQLQHHFISKEVDFTKQIIKIDQVMCYDK